MKVVVVPSAQGGGAGQPLSSYLIDDRLAVDAGALGFYGSIAQQSRISDILLTHSHMDHVAGLTILVDNVYEPNDDCVTVHAAKPTLDSLRDDLFNDRLYPDMIAMSKRMPPFLRLCEIKPRKPFDVSGYRVTPIPVDHVVPCLAYIIDDGVAAVAIITDTGPTEEIWQALRSVTHLKAIFLECSFPDAMLSVAKASKHLTVSLFADELKKAPPGIPVLAVHIKPRYVEAIDAGLKALRMARVKMSVPGRAYRF